jgi:hypothetical protein
MHALVIDDQAFAAQHQADPAIAKRRSEKALQNNTNR